MPKELDADWEAGEDDIAEATNIASEAITEAYREKEASESESMTPEVSAEVNPLEKYFGTALDKLHQYLLSLDVQGGATYVGRDADGSTLQLRLLYVDFVDGEFIAVGTDEKKATISVPLGVFGKLRMLQPGESADDYWMEELRKVSEKAAEISEDEEK